MFDFMANSFWFLAGVFCISIAAGVVVITGFVIANIVSSALAKGKK